MKTLALCLAILIGLTACTNVGQQLVVARTTFNATLTDIHTGHQTGLVTSKAEAEALPYLKVVQTALDAGDASWKAGDTTGAKTYTAAALSGLAKLDQVLHAAATRPTSKPAK